MILETVKKVLAGDSQAYREIVREYGPMVRVQLFSHLKDHHAVEDLSQEVFVAAYWALESYDPARDILVRAKLPDANHDHKHQLERQRYEPRLSKRDAVGSDLRLRDPRTFLRAPQ